MKKGCFIVFEGGEGSGKTTTSLLVKEQLAIHGVNSVEITREPGGLIKTEEIRDIIMKYEVDYKTEALLFAAARKEHIVDKILPLLEKGFIVICDRYILSSIVYQGYARGLGVEAIKQLNDWATDSFYPELTIFFDVKPEVALNRITNEREINRFDKEAMDFHQKLYKGYKNNLCLFENVVEVDASKSLDEVVKDVTNVILEKINE